MRNSRQRQFCDKTAYVGGQDARPKLRFSCSVAATLQHVVPPWYNDDNDDKDDNDYDDDNDYNGDGDDNYLDNAAIIKDSTSLST